MSEPKRNEPGCVVVWERRKTHIFMTFYVINVQVIRQKQSPPHALLPEKDVTGQVRVADTCDVAGTGLQGLGLDEFLGTSIPGACRWAAE